MIYFSNQDSFGREGKTTQNTRSVDTDWKCTEQIWIEIHPNYLLFKSWQIILQNSFATILTKSTIFLALGYIFPVYEKIANLMPQILDICYDAIQFLCIIFCKDKMH